MAKRRPDLPADLLQRFGRSGGGYEGSTTRYHDLAIDKAGNIYIGYILNDLIQKFKHNYN
jgi:peptidylamidoglycolate lyase